MRVGTLQHLRAAADVAITMPALVHEEDPIVASLARGVAGAARGAAGMGASLARHAVWYVRYRVDGNSRAEYKRDQRNDTDAKRS
jgi:hypothetical protein